MSAALQQARRRIQRCLLLLARKDLPKEERYRAGRHLWYYYGYIDALKGERP